MELKQFVPSDYCLKCVGCCRFLENPTIWAPQGFRLVKNNNGYRCEHLKEENNRCAIYPQRPLDCRLYPFLLVKKGSSLQLGLHESCCFVEEKQPAPADIQTYAQYLKNRLNSASFISAIRKNPEIASDYQENVELITDLKDIFTKAYLPKLNTLTLKDKPRIEGYLLKSKTSLSARHFVDIFIWKDLFQIFWVIIEDELGIFYQDKIGMFMMLPPLGKFKPVVVKKCFEIMNGYNQNSAVSRIENIAREDTAKYSRLGLNYKLKDTEYLCLRKDLIELAGGGFKSKRSSCNYFVKNYRFDFLEYKDSYYRDCLKLYQSWSRQRKDKREDVIYQQMLEDSFLSFKTALRYYKKLGLSGYVVKIGGKIKACTFGYPLNKDTFCVLFEICDLNFKGIAQYIFREFCKKLSGYKYINIMGASDLENLKKVKLSYRPKKEIGVYNIYQK
ncbi:MAG TPA: hypothetical protein DEA99_00805 [Candidatus Omnitrophica bacterium]|nr:hypothetical protein [Candidatus Omnitrophota bacterium]